MQQKGGNESHFTVFQICLNIKWLKFYLELLCVNMCKRKKKHQPNKQKEKKRGRNGELYEYSDQ